MDVFTWVDGPVPSNLQIKQVYGLLFTDDGRLLLRKECSSGKTHYSLAGGKPEKFDKNLIDTLKRECVEEINTTLKGDVHVIGYQLVNEGGGVKPYAQLRMVAMIDKIGKKKPDPDGGQTYDRLLTTSERAISLLNWGKCGAGQVNGAVRIAKEKFGLKSFSAKEEFV